MSDDLTLRIGNKLITGWDNIRVTRSIERLANFKSRYRTQDMVR